MSGVQPSGIAAETAGGAGTAPAPTAEERPMSLITTPSRELATCGRCAGRRVTAITMTLTDGTSVDFSSCHSCEHKSWKQGGRELDIATVLTKTQKHKQKA